MSETHRPDRTTDIAVVGMSGRFPGAKNVDEFWQNLRDGVESIYFFTDGELLSAGVVPALLNNPAYVKARGILEDIDLFDADFFSLNPREAEIMDPQQRVFLECAWEALENAGYDAETYKGRIGVYAGVGLNSYLLSNLYSNRSFIESTSGHHSLLGNDKDFLSTRISYKLNLKGPSVGVQTACSTSLVAVHLACQSLLNGECSMALAGGVSISVPQTAGYNYEEGGILSPDGHCRAFDSRAQGTVGGSGAGIVVLKRFADALVDGDFIHAVVKGSAINNDGALKIGYTAPSVAGQSEVIGEALSMAGVEAGSVGYVEAHGTGTVLGDPIEMAALTQAFLADTQAKNFCAIGSVKTNIGHLDTAAGVTGLIKTVLALENKLLPPSLHFSEPNPAIDFQDSPFYVNTQLSEWRSQGAPRRAGVSSFGIGGTNAHVIVEEAPPSEAREESRYPQLFLLSARTGDALRSAASNLADHLKRHPELRLADVAYTLQIGRQSFERRMACVCPDLEEAVRLLETQSQAEVQRSSVEPKDRRVAFMFPGQGSQHVNMAAGLYEFEPSFREAVDYCSEQLKAHLGFDLRRWLFPREQEVEEAGRKLAQTSVTQPALFVVEYGLAQMWMKWGVRPEFMIGHSIGEYVAACLSGVFSLEDALALVAARGRLMQQLPGGVMLNVPLSEKDLAPLLNERLSLAAVNDSSSCVVSGEQEAVNHLERELTARGLYCHRLHTAHAFHSSMMEPILREFAGLFETVKLCAPAIPYLSNLTGTWITAEQATDANYWTQHLRQTVRFASGLHELLKIEDVILLEVGPGQTLTGIAKRQTVQAVEPLALPTLQRRQERRSSVETVLDTLGKLWVAGRQVDWSQFHSDRRSGRVPLPSYPFQRKRYWIEPQQTTGEIATQPPSPVHKRTDMATWFYAPLWKQSVLPLPTGRGAAVAGKRWLVFMDECGLGEELVKRLELEGHEVLTVMADERFEIHGGSAYGINPRRAEDYHLLFGELDASKRMPDAIAHLWSVTPDQETAPGDEFFQKTQHLGFYSLLFLAQALGHHNVTQSVQINVISNHMQSVAGGQKLCPEKATVLGPCKVIPQEYPNIACRSIDFALPKDREVNRLIDQILSEVVAPTPDALVAYRGNTRWVKILESVSLNEQTNVLERLRKKGVYLITGGLGGLALEIAEYLAQTVSARLILTGRSAFPPRDEWERWLADSGGQDEVSRKIRKLQDIEAHGGEVLVISADVTECTQMKDVLAQVHERYGVIHGVIHAAGVSGGGLIHLQTAETAASVLAPKVDGLRVLESVFKDIDLDFLVLCSSLSSVLGGVQQVDYCAANFFLDAFAHYDAAKSGRFTVSINWDAWRNVGMATRKTSPSAHKGRPSSFPVRRIEHPLLNKCIDDAPDRKTYSTEFSVPEHWVLNEHRIAGNALLPGTAYLEIARAAFEEQAQTAGLELSDVYFLNILHLEEGETREVQTVVEKNGEHFNFVVRSAGARDGSAQTGWQEHAMGKVRRMDFGPPRRHDLKEIMERCRERVNLSDEAFSSKGLGPRWDSLKTVYAGAGEILAFIELPDEFSADLAIFKLHPALMDVATGVAKQYLGNGGSYLPLSYKSVRMRKPLSRRLYSYAVSKESNRFYKEVLTFDIIIMDEQGIELVEIDEFSVKIINDAAQVIKAITESRQHQREESQFTADVTASNYGRPFKDPGIAPEEPSDGLSPEEGKEVLSRILSQCTLPQIVVSTNDIYALIAHINLLSHASVSEQARMLQPLRPATAHARPDMPTPYVAPGNATERSLANIWQELLGIDRVGIHDNFFELGGDSIVAIHITARSNEMGFQLGPQLLFNHPTVAMLAAVTDATQPTQLGQPTLLTQIATPADDYRPVDFELAILDERRMNKISQLFADRDEVDDERTKTLSLKVPRFV
jgi:acyl transferase domain-containing protein